MNAHTFQFPDPNPPVSHDGPGKVIVGFAGGGGSCAGIEAALGRPIDDALNHDWAAICMHKANHPHTKHWWQSIWSADPVEVAAGRAIDVAWFSPDCKHFSKAKGGKPVEKNIRDLAWVILHYVTRLPEWQRPKLITIENVEEFEFWSTLIETENGWVPDPSAKGNEFSRFIKAFKRHGYKVSWKVLRASDYGVPTIRKRLFIILRRDGRPIVWPEPTHSDPKSEAVMSGKLPPWHTAAECIDWSIPCPSIFDRSKPLKDATCRRIAAGIMRYVINAKSPFIVPLTHHGSSDRLIDPDQPLPTVTGANRGEMAVVVPHITKFRTGSVGHAVDEPLHTVTANSFIKRPGGSQPLAYAQATLVAPHVMTMRNAGKPYQGADEPAHTVTAGGAHQFLVSAFLAQHNSGFYEGAGRPAEAPVSTVTSSGSQQGVVTSHLVKLRGTCADGQPVDEPMPTITAGGLHVGEVRAFLLKYYGNETDGHCVDEPLGTVTTKERFGLVMVNIEGQDYVVADIGMRMLTPRELARAQGFPDSYILDPVCTYETETGNKRHGPLPKTQQIAKIGNSVCPAMAEVLTRANGFMYAAPQPESEAA